MRLAAFFTLFVGILWANPHSKCVSAHEFSYDQKEIIAYAYNYGKKYGFGYTLAAIAWHESCAGEYRMNFADPSAGLYHALIPGVIRRYNMLTDNGFNRNVIGEMLVRDDEFASKVAIDELLYWDKTRKGNWKEIVKSYNKGFSWEKSARANELAEKYYESIKAKREILEDYIPKHLAHFKLKERKPLLSEYTDTRANKDAKNSTQRSAIVKKQNIANLIRRVETQSINNFNPSAIARAREAKKAVIVMHKKNDDGTKIHQKTIIMNPVYK